MTNARVIRGQHPNNVGAIIQTMKGRPSPPKEIGKIA
jgi:hypothetical protein